MSYEKYIKYKTKYLNLKAEIHNNRIQSGGGIEKIQDNLIDTLGSTPNSEIYNKNYQHGGANNSESDLGLPNRLSSSTDSKSDSEISTQKNSDNQQKIGGARKIKKNKNVFSESKSDSDFNNSDSSMLSFSSVKSDSSSDLY